MQIRSRFLLAGVVVAGSALLGAAQTKQTKAPSPELVTALNATVGRLRR